MLDELQANESQWKTAAFAKHHKEQIKHWKMQLKRLSKSKSCAEAGLFDPTMLKRSLNFYESVAAFLLKTLTNEDASTIHLKLPLPNEIPSSFTALPEWYVEDIAVFLLLILQ